MGETPMPPQNRLPSSVKARRGGMLVRHNEEFRPPFPSARRMSAFQREKITMSPGQEDACPPESEADTRSGVAATGAAKRSLGGARLEKSRKDCLDSPEMDR